MKAPANAVDFPKAPPGNHPGYLTKIIDLGTTFNEMYSKDVHKVCFVYELTTCLKEPNDEGKQYPFQVTEFLTLSMNEKANLRKRVESWLGRAFDNDEEAENYDIVDKWDPEGNPNGLLGRPGLIGVIHAKKKNGDIREQVTVVMSPPTGVDVPKRLTPLLKFDLSEFDKETFEKLGQGYQRMIKDSKQYRALYGNDEPTDQSVTQANASAPSPHVDDDFDDDIPF